MAKYLYLKKCPIEEIAKPPMAALYKRTFELYKKAFSKWDQTENVTIKRRVLPEASSSDETKCHCSAVMQTKRDSHLDLNLDPSFLPLENVGYKCVCQVWDHDALEDVKKFFGENIVGETEADV